MIETAPSGLSIEFALGSAHKQNCPKHYAIDYPTPNTDPRKC